MATDYEPLLSGSGSRLIINNDTMTYYATEKYPSITYTKHTMMNHQKGNVHETFSAILIIIVVTGLLLAVFLPPHLHAFDKTESYSEECFPSQIT